MNNIKSLIVPVFISLLLFLSGNAVGCATPTSSTQLPVSILPRHTLNKMTCASFSVLSGDRVIGAGTFVKYKNHFFVITAAHVATETENKTSSATPDLGVAYSCGEYQGYSQATIRYVDSTSDVAVITPISLPPFLGFSAAKISKTEPKKGDIVIAIGSPTDFATHEQNLSMGVISNVEECNNGICYRTDAATYFGNSGGGLFNAHGEYIGMTVGMAVTILRAVVPGSGVAVSRNTILKHLRRALDQ